MSRLGGEGSVATSAAAPAGTSAAVATSGLERGLDQEVDDQAKDPEDDQGFHVELRFQVRRVRCQILVQAEPVGADSGQEGAYVIVGAALLRMLRGPGVEAGAPVREQVELRGGVVRGRGALVVQDPRRRSRPGGVEPRRRTSRQQVVEDLALPRGELVAYRDSGVHGRSVPDRLGRRRNI